MRKILALLLALWAAPCAAQTVQQSGTVTPGHAVRWITNGVVGDAGSATNGFLTSIGVVASGPAICQSSASSGAYNRICLTASSTGGGFTLDNIGGATGGYTFTLNGVAQGFPTISLPTTAGDAVCFSNTTGTLTDCGVPITGGGIDTNVLNARTAAYTLQTTDCGKTVTLGGSAFYALTVGAASGFPATCSVVVANIDTVRWKFMSITGITFPNGNYLGVGQSFSLKNESNTWTVVYAPRRINISTSTTFYVDTSAADDSSDCLSAGSGTGQACKTLATVVSRVCTYLDINALVTIQLTSGQTHASQSLCNYTGNVAAAVSNPTIVGDASSCTNAANYTIDGGATISIIPVGVRTPWIIKGVKIANSSNGVAVEADAASVLYLGANITFPAVSFFHVRAFYLSFVEFIGDYCITGGALVHADSENQGQILIQPGHTVTITNTPAFSVAFAQTKTNGLQTWTSTTFSGSATGVRYTCETGGGINTNGGGVTFLPGNAATTGCTSPGWYQ